MEGNKRAENDFFVDSNNNYKRLKFDDSIVLPSLLEQLPNEIMYETFAYLETTHAYDAFFDLNTRFRNLFLHSNVPIQMNISNISKSTFERYQKNIMTPNQHRINYLRLSNPFVANIVFSPPRAISRFVQMEKLVLDGVHTKYLENILIHAKALDNLHSFVINLVESLPNSWTLWRAIFRLPHLKHCNVTYHLKYTEDQQPSYLMNVDPSPIEHLVINTPLRCDSLDKLFSYLPNLRRLCIDSLLEPHYDDHNFSSTLLKYLRYVLLKLGNVTFDHLEQLISNYFHHVDVFILSTGYDKNYFDADRWEKVIKSSMPELLRFEFRNDTGVSDNPWSYRFRRYKSSSRFWNRRGWNFNHRHTWFRDRNSGLFYSTDRYRRKEYYLCNELEEDKEEGCSFPLENELETVEHLRISSRELPKNPINYFPNVTKLSIENFHLNGNGSNLINLNRLVPLKQLTYLCLEYNWSSIANFILFIDSIPNLHTVKLQLPCINEKQLESLERNEIFQEIAANNQIRVANCSFRCQTTAIRFVLKFFPRLEYLTVSIDRKEIKPIISYIFQENFRSFYCLASLCLTGIPKVCLQEVDRFIKSKNLLNNYSLKYFNQDLYIWW